MNNRKHDAARINKILSIRAAALGTTVEELRKGCCPTCTRPAYAAHLRCDARGHAFEGCVDAVHDGQLQPNGRDWYYRPAAQQIRARELASISH